MKIVSSIAQFLREFQLNSAAPPLRVNPDTGALITEGVENGNLATAAAELVSIDGKLQPTASGALLIGNNRSKLRDDFAGPALSSAWQTVSTGSGMTVTVGNGTTSAYLNIASGVTANAETIIRSVDTFRLPLRLAFFPTASQRIANQEFFVELVETDQAGNVLATASAATNAGTSPNYASVKFDGTSATTALVVTRGGGVPEFVSASSTITTTAANGTGPNFTPAGAVEMQATAEHVAVLQAAVDSGSAWTMARRITQVAPNPDGWYKVQIRARNLGTAPASSTDWRLHAIRLFDYTRLTTEVIGGVGNTGAGLGVTINVAGGSLSLSGSANSVQGNAAHAASVSGNPVLQGVEARTSLGTATTSGQATRVMGTVQGSPVVTPYSIPEQWRSINVALTATTDSPLAGAPGAGLKNHVTRLFAINTGAALVELILKDGTTERERYPLPVNVPVPLLFPTPMQISSNAIFNGALSATGTVRVTGGFFIAP